MYVSKFGTPRICSFPAARKLGIVEVLSSTSLTSSFLEYNTGPGKPLINGVKWGPYKWSYKSVTWGYNPTCTFVTGRVPFCMACVLLNSDQWKQKWYPRIITLSFHWKDKCLKMIKLNLASAPARPVVLLVVNRPWGMLIGYWSRVVWFAHKGNVYGSMRTKKGRCFVVLQAKYPNKKNQGLLYFI